MYGSTMDYCIFLFLYGRLQKSIKDMLQSADMVSLFVDKGSTSRDGVSAKIEIVLGLIEEIQAIAEEVIEKLFNSLALNLPQRQQR